MATSLQQDTSCKYECADIKREVEDIKEEPLDECADIKREVEDIKEEPLDEYVIGEEVIKAIKEEPLDMDILSPQPHRLHKENVCTSTALQTSNSESETLVIPVRQSRSTVFEQIILHKKHLPADSMEAPAKCPKHMYANHMNSQVIRKQALLLPQDRTYKCRVCSFASNWKFIFKDHLKVHEPHVNCRNCSISAKYKSCFTNYVPTHSDVNPFKCCKCPFTTNLRSSLLTHFRVHSNEKDEIKLRPLTSKLKCSQRNSITSNCGDGPPYKCNQCSYSASQMSVLKRHHIIHSLVRPFKCDHCSYATKWKSALKRHSVVHSSKRTFKCNSCSCTAKADVPS